MPAKSITEEDKVEELADDVTEKDVSPTLDQSKLAALKAKSQAKLQEQNMASKIVAKKERSLALGIVGSGQAGSRLAEAFYKLGYDCIAINTAMQDLKHINIPDSNKLLLEGTLGGAAKTLSIGHDAAESHRSEILQLVDNKLGHTQVYVFCTSLGGGSGAGSTEVMIDILSSTGKPTIVIAALPMENEDAQTKSNALETLSKLSKFAQSKKIHNLIIVDNAKIESIYSNVSQLDFFDVANKAIVEPIDVFNTLSSSPSSVKAIDNAEFAKLLIDGEGLTVYGSMLVPNFTEDTAIAEAIINNLDGNLLASGFDLKQCKYVGAMIVANKNTWSKIPSVAVNYGMELIQDRCGQPLGIFKGIYSIDEMADNEVKVYTMISGLGLPTSRVEELKKSAQQLIGSAKVKDEVRTSKLTIDTGITDSSSAAQKIKEKIAQKSSAFGKLMSGSVVDRRK
jgi:cell division GTPase FtsZ